jgi:molecular chaperone DnaK
VEVVFDIDSNGIVKVFAKDLGTGKEQAIRITSSSGLSKEEMDGMIADAERYKEMDRLARERAELVVEGEGLIYATKRAITEFGAMLPGLDLEHVKYDIDAMKKCIDDNGGIDDLRKAISNLESSAHQIAEMIYGGRAAAEGGEQPAAEAGQEEPPAEDSKPSSSG